MVHKYVGFKNRLSVKNVYILEGGGVIKNERLSKWCDIALCNTEYLKWHWMPEVPNRRQSVELCESQAYMSIKKPENLYYEFIMNILEL